MSVKYTAAFAAIAADDLGATVAFYSAVLGREPDERVRDIYVAFHLSGMRLGIFSPRASHRAEFAGTDGRSGGLSLVLSVPDLEQARTELAVLNPAQPPGPVVPASYGPEFYAYDPDGNRLIVVESAKEAP